MNPSPPPTRNQSELMIEPLGDAAGSTPAAIVLQAAVNVVIQIVADTDMIELANRDVGEMIPVVHAVVSDMDTTVVTENLVSTVVGIDPEGVMIHVDSIGTAIAGKGFAAVLGSIQ